MKIKKDYELKELHGEYVVVNNSVSTEAYNTIVLSDTAVFLWNLLKEKDLTKKEMLDAVLENFDISTVLALGNVDVFVKTLKKNEIIE